MKKIIILFCVFLVLCIIKITSYKSESYLRSKVVQLKSDEGSCSGVQVNANSGINYILTAGHCEGLADKQGRIDVRLDGGKYIKRRIIEVSKYTDLMLLEGIPDLKGLDVAEQYRIGEHLRSFTHGAGLDTYKTEGELIQVSIIDILIHSIKTEEDELMCSQPKHKIVKVQSIFGDLNMCALHIKVFMSTAQVVPGSSGGLIVNDKGQIVGIVSGGDAVFGAFVPQDDIIVFLERY